MFKYIVLVFLIPCMANAQQNKSYYAVPYLEIEDVWKLVDEGTSDFGYNINQHTDNSFLKSGYYMWVDDTWYEIINASELFEIHNDIETLFTVDHTKNVTLKIKDINEVVYLYPIEALDTYKVSQMDFNTLSQVIEKKVPKLFEQSLVVEDALSIVETTSETALVEEDFSAEFPEIEEVMLVDDTSVALTSELPSLQQIKEENVLISSEDSTSGLLDVIEIVEVITYTEIPFEVTEVTDEVTDEVTEVTDEVIVDEVKENLVEVEIVETENKITASPAENLIILNPTNDYEVAVNEGFEGTVTEWIEMIDAQGGKTAYEQAVEKGYEGSEKQWMRMLWGREVDVETAKRDRTATIVSEWIQSLNNSKGNSPYELALKHGFYGTYTEWVESVVGTDGEKAYEHEKSKGFKGTYKEWIEKQLNASNQEVLRKELLSQTQMFVAPNVQLPLQQVDSLQVLEFNLFTYYNQYYGSPVISSGSGVAAQVQIRPNDLEYQITWFEKDKVQIIELNKEGIMRYRPLEGVEVDFVYINVRYLLK